MAEYWMFKARDGRIISASSKIALFKRKNNMVKGKALLTLYIIDRAMPPRELYPYIKDICASLRSLRILINRWTRWHYVNRYGEPGNYHYRIAARGRKFIFKRMPKELLQRFYTEYDGIKLDNIPVVPVKPDK
jgi:hypothetical protein